MSDNAKMLIIVFLLFFGIVISAPKLLFNINQFNKLKQQQWEQECSAIDVRTKECTEYTLTKKETK